MINSKQRKQRVARAAGSNAITLTFSVVLLAMSLARPWIPERFRSNLDYDIDLIAGSGLVAHSIARKYTARSTGD